MPTIYKLSFPSRDTCVACNGWMLWMIGNLQFRNKYYRDRKVLETVSYANPPMVLWSHMALPTYDHHLKAWLRWPLWYLTTEKSAA